jgi:uncharacterized protein
MEESTLSRGSTGGREPLFKVRRSKVHGMGVFALRPIRKGRRIVEYLGDRITHAEADRRYDHKPPEDNHTFLFTVDRRTVIDGGVNGNEARYMNHSCDPNCESVVEDRRVFIEAIRSIAPGEELVYDYQIGREDDDPQDIDEVFACRCGAKECRGTMLWPAERPKKKAAKKKRAQARRAPAKKQRKRPTRPATRSKRGKATKKKAAR